VEAPLTRDLESRRMWTSLSTRLAAAALRIAARLRSPAIGMVTHTTGGARVRAACGRASQAARLHHSSRRRPPPLSYSTSPSLQLLPSVSAREKEEGGGLDERKRGGDWGTGGRRRHGNQPCWSREPTKLQRERRGRASAAASSSRPRIKLGLGVIDHQQAATGEKRYHCIRRLWS
jgi:hypothetical protein